MEYSPLPPVPLERILDIFMSAMQFRVTTPPENAHGVIRICGTKVQSDLPGSSGYMLHEKEEGKPVPNGFTVQFAHFPFNTEIILISHAGVGAWMMVGSGEYHKDALPFLTAILTETYEARKFYGGRGPPIVEDFEKRLRYTNDTGPSLDWTNFKGTERIIWTGPGGKEVELGIYTYWGRLLPRSTVPE